MQEGESPGTILEALMKSNGKVQQSTRAAKLCEAHSLLQSILRYNRLDAREGTPETPESLFGDKLSWFWESFALPNIETSKYELITRALKHLCIEQAVQDKIQILQGQLTYLDDVSKALKKIDLGAPRTEGIRKALINFTPISGAFTSELESVTKDLVTLNDGSDEDKMRTYLDRSLTGKT